MKLFKVKSIHSPEHGMEQMIWCKNKAGKLVGTWSQVTTQFVVDIMEFRHMYYIYFLLFGDDNYSVFGYGYEHRRHSRLSTPEPKSDARLTQNLFVGSQHASHLIYPPSSGSGGHPGPGSLHLSRSRIQLLIRSLSSIHLTRPRQYSHAHTPQELSSSGWHEISYLTAAWRHGHDQARSNSPHGVSTIKVLLFPRKSFGKFWLERKDSFEWYFLNTFFVGKSFYGLTSFFG